jgi:hypothetical protein
MKKKLKEEIEKYCELNNIEDIDKFVENMVQQGFNVEKYGMGPIENFEPKVVEKEVPVEKIVEVIKEIPVEKIVEVEVEKIVEKEIPVEKIVEVEKEVYVTDDEGKKVLIEENERLKNLVESHKRNETVHKTSLKEKVKELNSLKESYEELKEHVERLEKINSNNEIIMESDVIQKLESKIKNLETELELEKNRHATRKKNEKPKHRERRGGIGNIINWVSKDERDGDVWGEG